MGSSLVVVTFANMDDAGRAREEIKQAEKAGRIKIQDSAVIVKDMDGKVKVQGEASSDAVSGGFIGGALGLLIATIFFPLAGIAIGALGGALVGHSLGRHVDKKFVKDVQESMQPGNSALFVMAAEDRPTALVAILRPFEGTLHQTNVDSELEEELRKALE